MGKKTSGGGLINFAPPPNLHHLQAQLGISIEPIEAVLATQANHASMTPSGSHGDLVNPAVIAQRLAQVTK